MTITDHTATITPPQMHFHQYVDGDTVTDLNAWAVSLFSPLYDDAHPAFEADDAGLHYSLGGTFQPLPIQLNQYIVLDMLGQIAIYGDTDFAARYTVNS